MAAVLKATPVHQQVHWSERIAHVVLIVVALAMLVFLAGPLGSILQQSVQDAQGRFAGLANFSAYAKTPALLESLWNSVWVSVVVTLVTIPAAFAVARQRAAACGSRPWRERSRWCRYWRRHCWQRFR